MQIKSLEAELKKQDAQEKMLNASVGSACPIHSDLGWHQDTERGRK